MKVKKQLHLFKIVLLVCLGLLFVINNNNQVMAMNNNSSQNISNVNNNIDEYNVFTNLLSIQRRRTQQIINALNNNVSETEINTLLNRFQQIHEQIITYQQNQLNNQQQTTRNFERNMTRIQLERELLLLIQEMDTALNNTPVHASLEQINVLRNIQMKNRPKSKTNKYYNSTNSKQPKSTKHSQKTLNLKYFFVMKKEL
ncbi:putative membrane protein, SVM family protein [Candidatus Phytoplasma solani]|uniref:SVM family protein n=1 Tax=Candidatus Phytoplasma solani TaxID=69896 RepID=UPI0032DA53A6